MHLLWTFVLDGRLVSDFLKHTQRKLLSDLFLLTPCSCCLSHSRVLAQFLVLPPVGNMLAARIFKLLFDRQWPVGAFKQRARPLIFRLHQKTFVQVSPAALVLACASWLNHPPTTERLLRHDFASLWLCSSFVSIFIFNDNSFLVCFELLISKAEALLTCCSNRALLRWFLLLSLLESRRLKRIASNAKFWLHLNRAVRIWEDIRILLMQCLPIDLHKTALIWWYRSAERLTLWSCRINHTGDVLVAELLIRRSQTLLLYAQQIIVGGQEINWWRLEFHCIGHHVVVLMVSARSDHIICIHPTLISLPCHVFVRFALTKWPPEGQLVRGGTLIVVTLQIWFNQLLPEIRSNLCWDVPIWFFSLLHNQGPLSLGLSGFQELF